MNQGKRLGNWNDESREKTQKGLPTSKTIINRKKKSVIRLNNTAFFDPSPAHDREENHPIRRKEINPTPSHPKNIERTFKLEVKSNINKINKVKQVVKELTSSFFI